MPLYCGSLVNQEDILERRPLGALKLAGNVIDPLTWCGAMTTTLCGGRGDPLSLWTSSLVELEIKVTVVTRCPRKRLDCRVAILLVSATTT